MSRRCDGRCTGGSGLDLRINSVPGLDVSGVGGVSDSGAEIGVSGAGTLGEEVDD